MKKILLLIVIVFAFSCNKETSLQVKKESEKFEVCSFGITNFNLSKRLFVSDYSSTISIKKRPQQATAGTGVIYLNFTGDSIQTIYWNNNLPLILNHSGLTQAEMDTVIRKVTAAFSIFNVIVTTDPNVYNTANPLLRTEVIFTESWEWYGKAGGVAYVGTFTWGQDVPAFVFTSLLGYNESSIGEAGSHEAGHTLGLYHQGKWSKKCVLLEEYSTGDGVIAPIMGYSYHVPAGSWIIGTPSHTCRAKQDDIAIIKSKVGLK